MTAIVKRLRKPLPTFPIRRRDPSYRLCVRAAWNIGTLQEFVSFALALNEVIPARIKDKHTPRLQIVFFESALRDNRAFSGCGSLTDIEISDSVTSIGDYAFYGCSSLANVSIGKGVTSIGTRAFFGCKRLTSIVLPEGVKSIADGAFYGSGLTSIVIPDGVESMGYQAFHYCGSLTSVTFKNPDGWMAGGVMLLSAAELSDPSTAAEYLRDKYCDYIWSRS